MLPATILWIFSTRPLESVPVQEAFFRHRNRLHGSLRQLST